MLVKISASERSVFAVATFEVGVFLFREKTTDTNLLVPKPVACPKVVPLELFGTSRRAGLHAQ